MSIIEAEQVVEGLYSLLKQIPELYEGIEALVAKLRAKEDPTPEMKHLQVLAAEKLLGI